MATGVSHKIYMYMRGHYANIKAGKETVVTKDRGRFIALSKGEVEGGCMHKGASCFGVLCVDDASFNL